MADYDFLPASNGSGDAALMHVTTLRLTAATTLKVDTVANVPAKFIGTYGILDANGKITAASKRDFKGHLSGADVIIDAFEPGSTDGGNAIGDVVVVRPSTGWANRVAAFIKNATNYGTPENLWAAIVTATSAVFSGDVTVGGNHAVTGNHTVTGVARLVPASTATVDGSGNITPTKQVFEVTALGAAANILAPTYSVADGVTGELQIKDNGTARALTWAAGWLAIGVTLPATTVATKYLYVSYRYNAADSKFHVLGIARQS